MILEIFMKKIHSKNMVTFSIKYLVNDTLKKELEINKYMVKVLGTDKSKSDIQSKSIVNESIENNLKRKSKLKGQEVI